MNTGRVYIIAEAGVNHGGSLQMAKDLIDVAKDAGADAVKFQTFTADALVTKSAQRAEYQKRTTASDESQWHMLKKLELSPQMHYELFDYCKQVGIEFLSTPFDLSSVDFLATKLGVGRIKVSSGDLNNAPLLLSIARTGLPVIVSTGMSTLGDVEESLSVLAFGYSESLTAPPSQSAFRSALATEDGQVALRNKVALLHCTSEYPASYSEINLRAMDTLFQAFGLPVGLSDHSEGIVVSLAAVARSATIIEKHFTLSRNLPGPDQNASLEPNELADLVRGIRQIEQALGHPFKIPAASELKNKPIATKSLVATKRITSGELFTEGNVAVKRPAGGIAPIHFWEILGQQSNREYEVDEMLDI